MANKALLVGIDNYGSNSLTGCVSDATSLHDLLETNADGSPNFEARLITSADRTVTASVLDEQIRTLFEGTAETVFFFFAGHGLLDSSINRGYLVTQDGKSPNWGVDLSMLVHLANDAHPRIKSTVIMLDCCHAGIAGAEQSHKAGDISRIGTGVTIVAACRSNETAGEEFHGGGGMFTNLVVDALRGGASDVIGQVTPAAIYSYIDQAFGMWAGQRPIYKANVDQFVKLRQNVEKVPRATIRKFSEWFRTPAETFQLDPSFEEDRSGKPESSDWPEAEPQNVSVFKALQVCNRHGLVEPVGTEHMYYAAVNSTGCRLTALGAHYWKMAKEKRI